MTDKLREYAEECVDLLLDDEACEANFLAVLTRAVEAEMERLYRRIEVMPYNPISKAAVLHAIRARSSDE